MTGCMNDDSTVGLILMIQKNSTNTIQSWKSVATVADAVFAQCKGNVLPDGPGYSGALLGQGFDSAGWFLVFRWDYCGV